MALVTDKDEPQAFKLCTDNVAAAKQAIILLNAPQDQLRNLTAALIRKRQFVDHLTSQISILEEQLETTKDEIADDMNREKTLI